MKYLRAPADADGKQEADLTLARETLRSSLTLAALGSLMRAFAHGGNNRLMVIMSCLDVLSLDTIDEQDRREALALASGASSQLADDLSALLSGARAAVVNPQRIELVDALQTAIELYGFMTGHPTPVAVGCLSPAWVRADPTELQPALMRLLLGAAHLGATAITATIATFDSAELAADLPLLRKGDYAGIEFEWVGATLPERLGRGAAERDSLLELLREPAGLEFASVDAYAQAMRGALHVRRDAPGQAHPRIRLLLPLQDRTGGAD